MASEEEDRPTVGNVRVRAAVYVAEACRIASYLRTINTRSEPAWILISMYFLPALKET